MCRPLPGATPLATSHRVSDLNEIFRILNAADEREPAGRRAAWRLSRGGGDESTLAVGTRRILLVFLSAADYHTRLTGLAPMAFR
jgi:hypothetical protein